MPEVTNELIFGPWSEEALVFDTLFIDGEEWPGIAAIKRLKRTNKWDRKIAKGEHGETQTFGGSKNADFEIQIRIGSSAEFVALRDDFLPKIEPEPGKKSGADPHSIGNPVTDFRKITDFIVLDIDGPAPAGENMWAVTISCAEHRKPEPKGATGTATGGNSKCKALEQQRAFWTSKLSDPDPVVLANAGSQLAVTVQLMKAHGCFNGKAPEAEPSLTLPDPGEVLDSAAELIDDADEAIDEFLDFLP